MLNRKLLSGVVVWFIAAYGILTLGTIPGDLGHALFGEALCGVWGWMPPLQALAALHGVWILAMVPVLILAIRRWPGSRLKWLGRGLLLFALLGIVGLAIFEMQSWRPNVGYQGHGYLFQRVAYQTVLWTDVPIIQLALAGIASLIAASTKEKTQHKDLHSPKH